MSTYKGERQKDREAVQRAKEAALAGTATYHIVEDSNLITYLKLDFYGFVAQERAGVRTPINLGVELPADVLARAWESASR